MKMILKSVTLITTKHFEYFSAIFGWSAFYRDKKKVLRIYKDLFIPKSFCRQVIRLPKNVAVEEEVGAFRKKIQCF